jgi:DNA-binding NarL/FixJ family response regulator
MPQTALIVEDHPLYRGALVHLMHAIVGEAGTVAVGSAEEGLRRAADMPDLGVVLLDLGLPGLSGMEAIHAYQRVCPGVPLIVVSASEDRQEATAALRAGAKIFMSKAVSTDTMADAARRALAGALDLPEWITAHGKVPIAGVGPLKLTPRQHDTLVLLCQGHSNKEIALRMGLAEITVKVHVSAVFRLLDVVNRTQAVLAARRLGLCAEPAAPVPPP